MEVETSTGVEIGSALVVGIEFNVGGILLTACLLLGAVYAASEEDDSTVPTAAVEEEEEITLNSETNRITSKSVATFLRGFPPIWQLERDRNRAPLTFSVNVRVGRKAAIPSAGRSTVKVES
ncbi:hypothetical protein EVAR_46270_1 [Eumeta japonica]|uniref:Uncharacterized protein n=1 Tax=Eumeta variegata TaxID=151549 RepID=A0A4C1Y2B2_EUMVA|nr:hypothetical protein EVAR_46270_1 [Eumeta japonica]